MSLSETKPSELGAHHLSFIVLLNPPYIYRTGGSMILSIYIYRQVQIPVGKYQI